jgi:hypothetical protein
MCNMMVNGDYPVKINACSEAVITYLRLISNL